MAETSIEWTDTTWNPTRGCRRVSEGCRNCYAEKQAMRMTNPGGAYEGLVEMTKSGPRWTGKGRLVPSVLAQPLKWRKPRRIFVDSMSDLFFEAFSFEEIAAVFGVMAACPQHTFQVLTKRPGRALEFFEHVANHGMGLATSPSSHPNYHCTIAAQDVMRRAGTLTSPPQFFVDLDQDWPLPNVHLGVSVEDQAAADERIPLLLQCPAAVRFLSVEPMLGPVDLTADRGTVGDDGSWYLEQMDGDPRELWACRACQGARYAQTDPYTIRCDDCRGTGSGIDWVICGGESGNNSRPMRTEWARSLRDQCVAAGVPFLFKQWGNWCEVNQLPEDAWSELDRSADGISFNLVRLSKKRTGRLLDGRTWDEFPR